MQHNSTHTTKSKARWLTTSPPRGIVGASEDRMPHCHHHQHRDIEAAIRAQDATTAPPPPAPPVVLPHAATGTLERVRSYRAARAYARARLAADPTWGTWTGRGDSVLVSPPGSREQC